MQPPPPSLRIACCNGVLPRGNLPQTEVRRPMPTPDSQPFGDPSPAVPDTRPAVRDDAPTVRSGGGDGSASAAGPWRGGSAALPLPEPGQRLESFELEAPIGVGGMGAVFLARD